MLNTKNFSSANIDALTTVLNKCVFTYIVNSTINLISET